ncbi:MAG: Uncharacterised protein [Flavobacterium sp. SCGC AAA160-P02]|nr:MAG: Uncharacterised protein [Flavobacterium sp. SCGC AAA160-P02]
MDIQILPYKKLFAKAFFELNIEWLENFFYVEDFDREVLSNPEKYILNTGGHIFFALNNHRIIGTVALMPYENKTFELAKMAVAPEERGKKIGQQLVKYCIHFTTEKKFDKLVLYSNTMLENAIYIYKKHGFKEIALEKNSPYKRSNIKMELSI